MSDERNPKEASKLFYDMIKAGVTPKATGTPKKKEVKPKDQSGNGIERNGKSEK